MQTLVDNQLIHTSIIDNIKTIIFELEGRVEGTLDEVCVIVQDTTEQHKK